MMLLKIAWRNIWRHRTRSLVIISSVVVGIWAGVFLMGFYYGMSMQRLQSGIEKEVSDLQIHHPEFKKDYDMKFIIPHGEELITQIQQIHNVKAVAGRTVVRGMISTATGSAGVQINGVMPENENEVTSLKGKLVEGNYFSETKRNELLIGQKLAKKLKLKTGLKAVITFLDKDANIVSGAFRIAGIYKTTNTPYEELNIFVDIGDINRIASLDNSVNEIAVLLKSHEQLDPVLNQIRQQHPELLVESWKEIAPDINLVVSATDESTYIFLAIILLGLAFGIVNTMLMAVLERTRELGMLVALGMNKSRVFLMILYETFLLVFAGIPVGILLSVVTVAYTGKYGINLSIYSEGLTSFGYDAIIYPQLKLYHYGVMLLMIAITALVSAVFPARKALSIHPSEAIRK